MVDITLTTTSTLNDGSITVHVYEDVGDDGAGPNSVTDVDGNTIDYENHASVALAGGTDEQNTLSGFDGGTGNGYYVRVVFGSLAAETDDPATFESWEIDTGGHSLTAGVGTVTLTAPSANISVDRVTTAESWRLRRPATGTVDNDLFDFRPLREAFNRFATGGTLYVLDGDGSKAGSYPYGTRIDVQYSTDGGATWTTRVSGIALDRTTTSRRGVPMLEIGMAGYDHLLRRRKVYKTYTSQSRQAILNDLITTFTAVNWVAGNVDVQTNDTITREFKGERVDECIAWLASGSANEEFGVNNSFEFFFRQQSVSTAPALGPEDVITHELPRRGSRTINWFRLYYGTGGSKSFVTVQDPEAQKELQNKLNAPRPVIVADSDTRPEISSEDAAKGIAEQNLGERSETLQGTITTFNRYTTNAGDVVNIDLPESGIDNVDFRVAQVEYEFIRDEHILTVAENTEGVEDLLIALSDSLANDRARDADTGATGTDFLSHESGVTLSVSTETVQLTTAADAHTAGLENGEEAGLERSASLAGLRFGSRTTTSEEQTKATTKLLDAARDVWQGEAAPDYSHLALGTSDTTPTQTDDGVQAEVDRVPLATTYGQGTDEMVFESGRVPPGRAPNGETLQEVSVADASTGGNHYLRAVVGDVAHGVDTVSAFRVTVTIDDDADLQGKITSTGQERARDLLIGETGHEPSSFVYGTGTSAVAEGDSSLDTQVHEDGIDSTADRSTGVGRLTERIGTGEVNNNDLTEVGWENLANELLARLVHAQYPKTSNAALETDWDFVAANP